MIFWKNRYPRYYVICDSCAHLERADHFSKWHFKTCCFFRGESYAKPLKLGQIPKNNIKEFLESIKEFDAA